MRCCGHNGVTPAAARKSKILEEGRGTTSPLLPFFLSNAFDSNNVGASLREHVMQIIADADEGETFFEEFTDATGAEKKKAEDDVVLAGLGNELFRGGAEFRRSVH